MDVVEKSVDQASSGESSQYPLELLEQVQLLWGEGFLSPGGREEVAKLVEGIDLDGRHVLDIGVGLGGPACVLAEDHGAARVTGIDVQNVVLEKAAAIVRNRGLADRIILQRVEPGPLPFADESFDIVFSKEAILQIQDKAALFREAHRVLRPGGWILISDWFCGESPFSREMKDWIAEWIEEVDLTVALVPIEKQAALLADAGFTDIVAKDRSSWFLELASRDAERMRGRDRSRLDERLGKTGAEILIKRADMTTVVVQQGQLRPGHLRGHKPE